MAQTIRKRKRKRSLTTADTMTDSKKSKCSNPYLADEYPSTRPIKVQLTAIRAGQARIFTTKLRAAGATVLDNDDSTSPSIVITDTPPCSQEEKPPIYVTPKWAEAVLRRRRAVSPTKFTLIPPEPEPETKPSLNESSSQVIVPSPWALVTGAVAPDDVRLRWLQALPKYAVERPTYEASVFESPNADLVVALREVARVRELLAGDGKGGSQDGMIRGLAYNNAAAAIASLPFSIRTSEAAKIRDVGLGVADATRQFLVAGYLAEADLLRTDVRVKALHELNSVYGVGLRTAQRLYDAGVRSTVQLHELARRHTNFADILKGVHIPRQPYHSLTLKQARAFRDAVIKAWKDAGLKYRVVLCGGYRRLKSKGHDVDILFCRADGDDEDDGDTSTIIGKAMQVVADKGWLRDTLHEETGNGRRFAPESTTHATPVRSIPHEVQFAVCEFEGRVFRVDFVGVRDAATFSYATLAWSGSVMFQRSLRRYSVKRAGLVFSKHGLFDAVTGQRAKIVHNVRTEHDVFHALGLDYRAPFERAA